MNTPDLKDRIRRADCSAPSSGLRVRVLAEADVARAPIAWTDRIWFSRACRQGALGMAIVLTAIAAWPEPSAPQVSLSSFTAEMAATSLLAEVAQQTGIEPAQAAAFARRAAVESRSRAQSRNLAIVELLFEGGEDR